LENLARKRITLVAKIVIGVGLLVFLTLYVEPRKIISTYKSADKLFLVIAFLLLPLNLYLQYLKWRILSLEYFGINENKSIWRSLFYGISGGIFTPMKSGEYVARAIPYKNAKVLDVALATVVDKLIPMFFIVLIGGVFFIIFLKVPFALTSITIFGIVATYISLTVILLYILFSDNKLSKKIKQWLKTKKKLEKIIIRISFLKSMNRKTFFKLLLASFLYHLTFTIQMTLLLVAFSGELNLIVFFFAANLIIFAQIVIPPIALGEVGVREGAAVYFLQNLGYTSAVGFSAALSLFFINLLIPSVIGLALLLKKD
jgi:uncharacterized protein (TIRG00374 family)